MPVNGHCNFLPKKKKSGVQNFPLEFLFDNNVDYETFENSEN